MKKLMVAWFKLRGWKVKHTVPPHIKKCVIIAAPHTSNWDFVYALSTFIILKLPVRFLAKKELFRWPLKSLLLSLGGMPVIRSKSTNMVDYMVDLFRKNDNLFLLIPAEGTRGWVNKWKTGFYNVAVQADVPVLLGYLDYPNKTAGFGPAIHLTGNKERDALVIRNFYMDKMGKHHDLFNIDAIRFD